MTCLEMLKHIDLIIKYGSLTSEELNDYLECKNAIEKELTVMSVIKLAKKNIQAGYYIDIDNPCIMIKDRNGDVVEWYNIDEKNIKLVNEVMDNE